MATATFQSMSVGSVARAALQPSTSGSNWSSSFAPRQRFGLPSRRKHAARVTMGVDQPRKGSKGYINETILTPRFYTTDFEQLLEVMDPEKNPNVKNNPELTSCLKEFENDYNQVHFVRDREFKAAADKLTGATRQIFMEFLERSCTAEFSGFLLYKEIGRRLKKVNPEVAECFTLMSRDEARHAGFLNKALTDFNMSLDLGFLTKNRKYTFFKPQFIFLATYLSEKIGYWRYIAINRHLNAKPEHAIYPLFKYFESWCQDENRHGDFCAALLKACPDMLKGWENQLWARFFCLSVYVTMYTNDHMRAKFYNSIGMDVTEFDMSVIIETNKTTERIFPAVLDVESPEFKKALDRIVVLNEGLCAIDKNDSPLWLKKIQKTPGNLGVMLEFIGMFLMKPVKGGSFDIDKSLEASAVY